MANPTERGETWERARKLSLKYPLLSLADLARLLGVSRARVSACLDGLKDEREGLRTRELERIKHREGL
jgi:biotin operon repressor